jgi:LysM repeat protein
MPGEKPPVDYFTDPDDQAIAKKLNFGQQNLNTMKKLAGIQPTQADVFKQTQTAEPQNATQAAQDAEIDKATADADNLKKQGAMDKELDAASAEADANQANATPGAPQQSAQPAAAPQQSAQPAAAGAVYKIKPGDNLTKIAKANGTTVQAIMQANPQIKDANKIAAGASLTLPGAGQSAQPAVAQAAPGAPDQSDAETARLNRQNAAANPEVAKIDAEIKRFSSNPKNNMSLPANQAYIAKLEAQKKAASGGQASQSAQPAAAPAAASPKTPAPKPGELGSGTYQIQSVRNEDDAILERIRNFKF